MRHEPAPVRAPRGLMVGVSVVGHVARLAGHEIEQVDVRVASFRTGEGDEATTWIPGHAVNLIDLREVMVSYSARCNIHERDGFIRTAFHRNRELLAIRPPAHAGSRNPARLQLGFILTGNQPPADAAIFSASPIP